MFYKGTEVRTPRGTAASVLDVYISQGRTYVIVEYRDGQTETFPSADLTAERPASFRSA